MKIFGIILLVLGVLALIGGLRNSPSPDTTVVILSYIVKLAMIVGGFALISRSNKSKD